MPVYITLSPQQLERAELEAQRRQSLNEQRGLRGRNNAPAYGSKALEMHRLGCIGEMAVASMLGLEQLLFSNQEARRGSSDLPGGIEVKTRSRHGYDLLVQLGDNPEKTFVLVTHQEHTTQVVGWIGGRDAMRSEYIRELVRGRPCYVVPRGQLRPVTEDWSLSDMAPEQPGRDLETSLKLPAEVLRELDWKAGDTLNWEVCHQTKTCVIRKVDNECSQDLRNRQRARLARDELPIS